MKKKKAAIGIPSVATFKVADLKPASYNPRTISDDALEGLTKSIERFGLVEPIVINVKPKRPMVIGGHQRLQALQALGVTEVVCVTVSCSKAEEKLLNITLNNDRIQGEFTARAVKYIEQLRSETSIAGDIVALKISQLREDLQSSFGEPDEKIENLQYKERTLRPYKRTHVLLSFDPSVFGRIQPLLEKISQVKGVEYEQASN